MSKESVFIATLVCLLVAPSCTGSASDASRSDPDLEQLSSAEPDQLERRDSRSIPSEVAELLPSSEARFTAEAEALGYTVRVVERDGEDFGVDADYLAGRLNVRVVDGDVIDVVDVG